MLTSESSIVQPKKNRDFMKETCNSFLNPDGPSPFEHATGDYSKQLKSCL